MRRFLVTASSITIAMLAAAGCSLFVDLDDLTGGASDGAAPIDASDDFSSCTGATCDGGSKSDASGSDAAIVIEAGPCDDAGTAGPRMVLADGYCIDSTEVTMQQYADFVAAGFTGTLPAECTWNTTYAPDTHSANDSNCNAANYDAGATPNLPVECVNWCDAWAYCKAAGKNLCGDKAGGSLDYNNPISASAEWYLACSGGGDKVYPTGNTYDGGCNTVPSSALIDVASDPTCVGGFPGLYDMAGNTEEWIDACDSSGALGDGGRQNDICHEGGDAFNFHQTGVGRCDQTDSDRRGAYWYGVGFRCCAPLP